MIQQFLDTGEIVSVHGIRGEVKINPWSDTPDFLCDFKRFYLDKNGTNSIEAERVRVHKNVVIAKIKGIDTVEDAAKLRGKTLYINRDDCKLDEGDFFVQDLIGMQVQDADTGEIYGAICDVSQTGANDVYHIRAEGKADKFIPAIKQVVLRIDLQANLMMIRPLEGLFDEN